MSDLDKLADRQLTDQEVLFLKLNRTMSMRGIAKAAGLSVQRVSDVIKRGNEKMAQQKAVKEGVEPNETLR